MNLKVKVKTTTQNERVKELLNSLALTGKYRGYYATIAACELLLEDETLLFGVTKNLYPKVAILCGCKESTIERNSRTAIEHIWENNRERLFEIAGYRMSVAPTVTEFFGILIAYLQRQQLVGG